MDTLLTGSFQNALNGTNVKKTNINSSSTGKVDIAVSSRRQASTELKVAQVPPSFGSISDNFKTCIRCFKLSDGADMMNIPGEAGTGILVQTQSRHFKYDKQFTKYMKLTSIAFPYLSDTLEWFHNKPKDPLLQSSLTVQPVLPSARSRNNS